MSDDIERKDPKNHKPWEGRFAQRTARIVETFTASIQVDKRLYGHDIEGSIAHCRMLAEAEIIGREEATVLEEGLRTVKAEIEAGDFRYDDALEDIHMHIESRLAELVGPVARKLHTARSRNDQIALDVRMYLREETRRIIGLLLDLRRTFVTLAEEHLGAVIPGYTHLQRAQPVLLSHHFLAYHEMFTRDADRFRDGLKRIDVMPLGSAALAGTTYPIDREYTAKLLGFPEISANSMDAVSDRDFVVEFLSAASLCMIHLSRLSEEMVLWASSEYRFVDLPDAFATGSSIMPQKKNPDVPELVRGKTGRVVGDLVSMLTLMKGLPLAYNRDMQEDKEPLFDAVDTVTACLAVYIQMLPEVTFNRERMRQATETGFLNATDLADYLVTKGMPFREAHGCVGRAVGYAAENGRELHELSLRELRRFSNLISEEIFQVLETDAVVSRRNSLGGTGTDRVKAAVAVARRRLDRERTEIPG